MTKREWNGKQNRILEYKSRIETSKAVQKKKDKQLSFPRRRESISQRFELKG